MNVVHTNEVEWVNGLQRGAYWQRRKKLGGSGFASSLWELAPGKKSFPFHKHHVTEEALLVLSGQAKVRTEAGLVPLGAGDFVSFTPGDAHQLINDGAVPFVYFALSVSKGADVTEYPDSKKVVSSYGQGPDAESFTFRADDEVSYFDGELDAGPDTD